jgi:hypothetical protein
VVSVECVPEPEGVGKPAQRQDRRVADTVEQEQAPPGNMEQADSAEERRQPAAFALIEGLSEEGSHGGHIRAA